MAPNTPHVVLKLVGTASILLCVLGLWYNLSYLGVDYADRENPPYFFQAWYTMAAVNIALLIAGVVVGTQLVRGKTGWIKLFVVLEVVILLEAFSRGPLWLVPRFGSSIAAATGISGGTFLQVLTLFPIWGALAALWAARRLDKQSSSVRLSEDTEAIVS